MYITHSFTIKLACLLFFQRSDPFNLMIKNYEPKQNEMMGKQAERCKKEMEYLQKKLKENLLEDTHAMTKTTQEDNKAIGDCTGGGRGKEGDEERKRGSECGVWRLWLCLWRLSFAAKQPSRKQSC